MGQKVNPISNRLGVIRGWDSNWFGGKNMETLFWRIPSSASISMSVWPNQVFRVSLSSVP